MENPVSGADNEWDGTPRFRVDSQGKAYGLGCLDMKGGIVIAIWVVKALQVLGWAERPVKFILAGDEDKGHFDADTPQLLIRLAKGAFCCFNMETGRVNNDICIGRKGGGEGELTVHGTAAHAGNDFLSGRNAVLEMAYKEIELAELNDLELGTTVAPLSSRAARFPMAFPITATSILMCATASSRRPSESRRPSNALPPTATLMARTQTASTRSTRCPLTKHRTALLWQTLWQRFPGTWHG